MPDKTSYKEFSRQIKEKYPEYANVDDKKLAQAMIEKYPVYAEKVSFDDEAVSVPTPAQPAAQEPATQKKKVGQEPFSGAGPSPSPKSELERRLAPEPIAGGFGDVLKQTQQAATPKVDITLPKLKAQARASQAGTQDIAIEVDDAIDPQIQRIGKLADAVKRIEDQGDQKNDPGSILDEFATQGMADPSLLQYDDTPMERLRRYNQALDYHRNIIDSNKKLLSEMGFMDTMAKMADLQDKLEAAPEEEKAAIQEQIFQMRAGPEFAVGLQMAEQLEIRNERMKEFADKYVTPLLGEAMSRQNEADIMYLTNPLKYEIAKPAIDLVTNVIKGGISITSGQNQVYDAVNDAFESMVFTSKTLPRPMQQSVFEEDGTNWSRLLPSLYNQAVRMVPTFAGAVGGSAVAGPMGGLAGASAFTFEAVYDEFFQQALNDPAFTEGEARIFAALQAGKTAAIEQIGGLEQRLAKGLTSTAVQRSIRQYKNDVIRGISKQQAYSRAGAAFLRDVGGELVEETTDVVAEKAINNIANYLVGSSLETETTPEEMKEVALMTILLSGTMSAARLSGSLAPKSLMKEAYMELAKSSEIDNLNRLVDRAVVNKEITRDQANKIKYTAEHYKRAFIKVPPATTDEVVSRIVPKIVQIQEIQESVPKDAPQVFKDRVKEQVKAIEESIAQDVSGNPIAAEGTIPSEQNQPVSSFINAPAVVSFDGRRGTLTLDGQRVIWQELGTNQEIDMGNVDEVSSMSLDALNLQPETKQVSINQDGTVQFRGESYVNNFSDKTAAINRDANGNVVSVNLETPVGQKRTFRGQAAEDIAYEITLQEIYTDETTRQEFENFINEDPDVRAEVEPAAVRTAPQEAANQDSQQVPGEQATPAAAAVEIDPAQTELQTDGDNVLLLDAQGKVLATMPAEELRLYNDEGKKAILAEKASPAPKEKKQSKASRKTIQQARQEAEARGAKENAARKQKKELNDALERGTGVTGVKAQDMRDLMKINQKLFGLGKLKALYSAVIMDRMVGVMARRAGITKADMYSRIEFRKLADVDELQGQALFQQLGIPVTIDDSGNYVLALNDPRGRLLNLEQSAELQEEIESNYANDGSDVFQKDDIRMAFFNYDEPFVEYEINGIDVRVATGLARRNPDGTRSGTYLLYVNGEVRAELYNQQDARGVAKVLVDAIRGNQIDLKKDAEQIPKKIRFQNKQGTSQAQGAAMLAADGSAIIFALTDPNVSTPMHEMAHVFEHYLTDAERSKVLKWAGHTEWSTETSEAFARGFEKYLADGVSPTKALKSVFDSFKEWLTEIYDGITSTAIDFKLNKPMRDIYAKMLGEDVVDSAKPSTANISPKTQEARERIQQMRPTTEMDQETKVLYQRSGVDLLGAEISAAADVLINEGFTIPEIETAMRLEYGYKFTPARQQELRKKLAFDAIREEVDNNSTPNMDTTDMIDALALEMDIPFAEMEEFHKQYMESTPGMLQRQGNLRKGQYKGLDSIKKATAEVANSLRTFYKQTKMADILEEATEFAEQNGGMDSPAVQDMIFNPEQTGPLAVMLADMHRKQMSLEISEINLRLQDPSLTDAEIQQLKDLKLALVRTGQRVLEAYEKKVGRSGLILSMARVFNAYTADSLIAEVEDHLSKAMSGMLDADGNPVLETMSEEQKTRLTELFDLLGKVDGSFHDYVIAAIGQYVRGQVLPKRFDMDTFISIYYGSILSGFMTQYVNAKAGFGSIVLVPFMKIFNPTRWARYALGTDPFSPLAYFAQNVRDFGKGFKNGWPAMVDILQNGSFNNKYFAELVKPQKAFSITALEIEREVNDGFLFWSKKESGGYRFDPLRRFGFKAKGKHFSLNPYNYLKYVTRGISAVDTLVTGTAYEMRLRETFMFNYAAGELNPSDYQSVTKVLDGQLTQEQSDKIGTQLQAEIAALQSAGIDIGQAKIQKRHRELVVGLIGNKLNDVLMEEAKVIARTDAFTGEVRSNTMIGWFAKFVNGAAESMGKVSKSKTLGAIAKLLKVRFIPFVNTLANVQDLAMDSAPLYGIVRSVWAAPLGARGSAENMTQRDRAWFGTMLFTGLLAIYALSGDEEDEYNEDPWITGTKPGRRWDQKKMEEMDIPSNSFKMFGKYWNYAAIPGLGIPMAIIGNMKDMERSKAYDAKDIETYWLAATSTVFGFWTQMGFMESVRNTASTIDALASFGDEKTNAKSADNFAGQLSKYAVREAFGMVGSTLPNNFNLFKQISKIYDPAGYARADWEDEFYYQVGVARFTNHKAIDIFGDEVLSYPGEVNTPYPKNFELKEVPEQVKWLNRVAKVGTPRQINRHALYRIGEDIRELTDDEYYNLSVAKGRLFKSEIRELMQDYDPEMQNYELKGTKPVRRIETEVQEAHQRAIREAMADMEMFDPSLDTEDYLRSQGLNPY